MGILALILFIRLSNEFRMAYWLLRVTFKWLGKIFEGKTFIGVTFKCAIF